MFGLAYTRRENPVPHLISQFLYHNCDVKECEWWGKNVGLMCVKTYVNHVRNICQCRID